MIKKSENFPMMAGPRLLSFRKQRGDSVFVGYDAKGGLTCLGKGIPGNAFGVTEPIRELVGQGLELKQFLDLKICKASAWIRV